MLWGFLELGAERLELKMARWNGLRWQDLPVSLVAVTGTEKATEESTDPTEFCKLTPWRLLGTFKGIVMSNLSSPTVE